MKWTCPKNEGSSRIDIHKLRLEFQYLVVTNGSCPVKKCLRTCAKCADSDLIAPCLKSQPGLCYPFIHSVISNDSLSGQ